MSHVIVPIGGISFLQVSKFQLLVTHIYSTSCVISSAVRRQPLFTRYEPTHLLKAVLFSWLSFTRLPTCGTSPRSLSSHLAANIENDAHDTGQQPCVSTTFLLAHVVILDKAASKISKNGKSVTIWYSRRCANRAKRNSNTGEESRRRRSDSGRLQG